MPDPSWPGRRGKPRQTASRPCAGAGGRCDRVLLLLQAGQRLSRRRRPATIIRPFRRRIDLVPFTTRTDLPIDAHNGFQPPERERNYAPLKLKSVIAWSIRGCPWPPCVPSCRLPETPLSTGLEPAFQKGGRMRPVERNMLTIRAELSLIYACPRTQHLRPESATSANRHRPP